MVKSQSTNSTLWRLNLDLNVNWAHILLVNMKDEMKKVKCKFESKGVMTQLNIKNNLKFCTKISLLILNSIQRDQ